MQPKVQQQRRANTEHQPMGLLKQRASDSTTRSRVCYGGAVVQRGSQRSPKPIVSVTSGHLQTKEISTELIEFLRTVGLTQFAPTLSRFGFDDMETILLLEVKHMKDFGMGLGQISKLKRSLATLAPPALPAERTNTEKDHEDEKDKDEISALPAKASVTPASALPGSETPALSTHNIDSVKQSWAVVESLGSEVVAELFYKNLFQVAPVTKELFPIAVRNRHRDWACVEEEDENDPVNSPALRKLFAKVLDAVGTAVAGLQDIPSLVPHLTALGMRHINYNTTSEHFAYGGQALLITLRAGLGELYTHDVEIAWKLVYDFVTATMMAGLNMARQKQEEINLILQRKYELNGSHRPGSSVASLSTHDELIDGQASTECSWTLEQQPMLADEKPPDCFAPPGGLKISAPEELPCRATIASQTKTLSCFDAPMFPRLLHSLCQGMIPSLEAKPQRTGQKAKNRVGAAHTQ